MAKAAFSRDQRRERLLRLLNDYHLNGRFDPCERRVRLCIAGVRVDFLTDSQPLALRIADYFAAYLGTGPACAEIRVRVLKEGTEVDGSALPLWDDPDAEFHIQGASVVHRDFVATRLKSTSSGKDVAVALMAPDLDESFHNLFRWFFPKLLLENGAFLLHGAGVIRSGRGYVFFGQSGAGKSTTVALISSTDPEARVIGDDAVIVEIPHEPGGQPRLHSAPLGCGYSRMAPPRLNVPIAGMFALRQDSRTRIESLSEGEGVAALLASTMAVGFDDEADGRFDLACRFAGVSSGIHALHFRRNAAFWPMILKTRLGNLRHARSENEATAESGQGSRNDGAESAPRSEIR